MPISQRPAPLRVSPTNVLIVPPFECAWLADPSLQLAEGAGCVSLEVRATNDVTLLFKAKPGSRRWQHHELREGSGSGGAEPAAVVGSPPAAAGAPSPPSTSPPSSSPAPPPESDYTVILGSHRNSCLKMERNGVPMARFDGVPGARLTPDRFMRVWVDFNAGAITVGAGPPGCGPCARWADPDAPAAGRVGVAPLPPAALKPGAPPPPPPPPLPTASVRHIGLSAWDAAVAYRAIAVGPPIDFSVPRPGVGCGSAPALATPPAAGPPPLVSLAAAAAATGPGAPHATPALAEVCRLAPALDALRPGLTAALAAAGPSAPLACPSALASLPADAVAELLAHPALVAADEADVYALVLAWAGVPPAVGGLSGGGGGGGGGGEGGGTTPSSPSATLPSPPRSGTAAAADAAASAPARPMSDLDALLPLVRFPLVDARTLRAVLASPLARASGVLAPLVEEALAAHAAAGLAGGAAPAPGAIIGSPPGAGLVLWPGGGRGSGAAAPPPAAAAAAAAPLSPPTAAPPPLTLAGPRGVAAASGAAALAAARHAARLPPGGVELLHMRDGDANGLLHWLGSAGGRRPWVNPVLAGALAVTSSSPPCRTTDPKALAAGAAVACNAAGPDRAGGGGAWWALDLGEAGRLAVTGYTLRADASGAYPRSWTLQASAGGAASPASAWHDLAVHVDDAALHLPGQYASWPVAGPRAAAPWRAFRLLLTGPNAAAATGARGGDCFALAGVELYGHFWPEGR